MTVKAVIFDLDGVITDTAVFHFQAWKSLALWLDIPFDQQDNEQMKGIERMASLEMILARGERDYSDQEKKYLCDQKNAEYQTLIAAMSPENMFPGVGALLEQLRRGNIRIGVASASKNAGFVLDRLGLTAKFDYIADARLIRRPKPDPEIFLTVARELDVAPEDCVGIEDAVAGIASIKAAGMYAIGIGDRNILTRADVVFSEVAKIDPGAILR
ncbi:MAG: beta-phosphoglucomutase [Alphaproteobacteria bacterium]|nr:beta-phosphoglucomutase [Alphaproteobacteria bacterium]